MPAIGDRLGLRKNGYKVTPVSHLGLHDHRVVLPPTCRGRAVTSIPRDLFPEFLFLLNLFPLGLLNESLPVLVDLKVYFDFIDPVFPHPPF